MHDLNSSNLDDRIANARAQLTACYSQKSFYVPHPRKKDDPGSKLDDRLLSELRCDPDENFQFDEIDIFDTKSPSQLIQDVEWGKHDTHYLDTLDVSWKERRTIYRALIFKNCPSMVVLDRIPVISGESGQSRLIISDYISLFDPK
ncbi:hypothetical protein K501DRAFT_277080 [Backusella circina FSU 941]|nr:hypothetical protein K501DRAFT_277080 [Backusella circina FSU 941]